MKKTTVALLLWGFLVWAGSAAAFSPNDPLFELQWNFQAMGMEAAWDFQRGRDDVTVAVIDSGVDTSISDFAATNFHHCLAFDFVSLTAGAPDENGHGTHVAGTLAQSTDNRLGVAGIAFNTRVLPLRVLDEQGVGSADDLAAGIIYAVQSGAEVINLSLGGPDPSPQLESACRLAYDNGVLVVAAAGNNGSNGLDYPAAYASVLAVGSLNSSLQRSSFSRHAKEMVMAPGSGIVQQVPGGDFLARSGTSMATPHVAGLAALILAEARDFGINPGQGGARVEWLKSVLINNALDLGDRGQDSDYGYGMVHASGSLARLATNPAPTAPLNTALGLSPSAAWAWEAPPLTMQGETYLEIVEPSSFFGNLPLISTFRQDQVYYYAQ